MLFYFFQKRWFVKSAPRFANRKTNYESGKKKANAKYRYLTKKIKIKKIPKRKKSNRFDAFDIRYYIYDVFFAFRFLFPCLYFGLREEVA